MPRECRALLGFFDFDGRSDVRGDVRSRVCSDVRILLIVG